MQYFLTPEFLTPESYSELLIMSSLTSRILTPEFMSNTAEFSLP